jgi:hypothetical protein
MKHLGLIIGTVALAASVPAVAQPGHGKHGHANRYATQGAVGYGVGGCPPGLAKKAIPCVPPGQAKKLFNVGQRMPAGFGTPYGYNQIPYQLRQQYRLGPDQNYYYGSGYLYGVDPQTMLVRKVIGALLR